MKKMPEHSIKSPESMIAAIRSYGIIPFFKGSVPGWSIEELTDPDYWFFSSDELGPWDWKIDAVREGDIAYGKFLGGKAAFATVDFYKHLMNYRRSLPKYRMALGERYTSRNNSDRLLRYIAPNALAAIKEAAALESKDLRLICSQKITPYQLKVLGAKYKGMLTPAIKKSVMDSVVQYLEMGTWVVTGDFTRVYRGANLEYSGWQRSSLTTPDALFGGIGKEDDRPSWARFIGDSPQTGITVDCSPEESRRMLIQKVSAAYPGYTAELEKIF